MTAAVSTLDTAVDDSTKEMADRVAMLPARQRTYHMVVHTRYINAKDGNQLLLITAIAASSLNTLLYDDIWLIVNVNIHTSGRSHHHSSHLLISGQINRYRYELQQQ